MNDEVATKVEGFFSQYRLRQYAKGQILIMNGDGGQHIHYLVKGKVKQYDVTYRGDEVILNNFKPPAFFPMSLAINKVDNPYIYQADSAIETRIAPADEVVQFIKANPDVMFDLLSRLYRGVDGMLGRMVHLMGSSAKSRLMYELLLEARRFGSSPDEAEGCSIDITEKDLGARAGLSRETVSREAHKLKADGLIEIRSKDILIKDVAALAKKLGSEI
jgi:CRP/FNR family transcriptional regulator, cyclic AMP receptor protein